MTYKTILLHLADDAGHVVRLDLAAALAAHFRAHVVALYIASPVSMPAEIAGRGGSFAYIAEATEAARKKAVQVERECRDRFGRHKLSWEWKIEEGDHLDILAAYAHYADLAIVSHSRVELVEDRVIFHVPEHLPLVVGCPVIVLPTAQVPGPVGGRILIAWKPCPQAARAVGEALPLLAAADEVIVLSVVPRKHEVVPGERLVAALERHGVKSRLVTDIEEGRYIGEVILAHARHEKADLMVMGAYGHSRLREMVLGGVTRHVLNELAVPVLLSH